MKLIVSAALLALLLAPRSVAQTPSATTIVKNGIGPVFFLRFSPNGRELARICQFGPVELFDTTSYDKARTFSVGMRMVAYSPDGSRIATAEGTDGARVRDAASQGKRTPDSRQMIVNELYVLDAPLQVLQAPSRDASQRAFWTEFSPDGKRLITTHANGLVKVWNTTSWAVEKDLTLTAGEVRAAAFAPDGRSVVIGDTLGVLHVWSLTDSTEVNTIRTLLGAITAVAFSPDGKTLVTTHQSASGTGVMIWNTSSWVGLVKEGFGSATFSKDGKMLALGGSLVELIDPESRRQIRTIELPEMTLRESSQRFENQPNANAKVPIFVSALAFSPDGRILAAGCREGTVRLVKVGS